MTLLSSPSPDLPPGTVSTATEATSTQPSSISLSYLHTHLPVTNISKSASKSFNTITPTNAILLTTRSIVNVPLSSPPNATQTGKPSTANVSTSNTILSNKFTNLSSASPSTPSKSWPSQMPTIQKPTNTESPISTPIPSTPPLIPAKELSLFLNGRASNVSSAPSNKNSSANLPVTRSDDFTGPVVMPVVANMEEFVPTQQQTTMSSLTQLGTSVAEKSDIQEERLSRLSTEKSLKEPSKSSSLVISGSTKGYLWNITSGPLNSSLSGLGSEDYILRNVTTNPAVARKINSSSSISYLDTQVTPLGKGFLNTSLPNVSTSPLMNVSSTNSSLPTITSVAPTTSVPDEDLSADYQADVYDVFTEDYVASTPQRNTTSGNGSTDLDLPSLRKKFLFQFTNMTNPPTSPLPNTTPLRHPTKSFTRKTTTYRPTLPSSDPSIDEDPLSFAASSVDNSTFDLTTSTIPYTTPLEEITAPILLSRNVTPAANLTFVADIPSVINVTSAANVTSTQNVTSNVSHAINKEQLQFPGITLKVSHVLIPKQKRSRYSYNIQNMRIELPKTESLNKAPPSVPKTSKNSNCTRFPVLVVTAADTESKEKVNLTEERYDCEFSSQIQSSTQQKEPVDRIRTYYGGYVFRYTIPKASNGSNATSQSSTEVVKTIDTTTVDDGDDYYPSYGEYLEMANGSSNSGIIDDAIFPDPIIRNEKISNPRTETYRVPLTESTIIDSDLHDRDVIDSVMYIYFGGASRGLHGAGSQIIIVGAVIALVAQFLTLASSIRRIKTHQGEEPTIILLNVEIALTLTNLIFILGVQSPGNHTLCRITAVSLYYLHLVTILWFLLSSLHCVQSVIRIEKPFKLYSFCICGWILPLIIASLSYLFNERSFETSSYCWVSPLRGVLFSYILPVIFLCSVCIVTTVYGLKRVTDVVEELDDTYSHRKLLRISAVSLPLFSIIWFTGMISLENSSSLLFSMIYLISNTVLNWLLFGCWLPTEASQWKDMDEDYYDDDEDFDDEPVLVKRRFDDQPLLSELYEYGAQGQLYNLRIEPISIISAP